MHHRWLFALACTLWMSTGHAASHTELKRANEAQANGAVGSAVANTPGFGVKGSRVHVGDWTVAFPAESFDAAIYRDRGDLAVEVIAGSVCWFHMRVGGKECTRYTSGDCDLAGASTFYNRPFETADRGVAVSTPMQFTLADPAFDDQRSTIFVDPSSIRVRLDDGGELLFEPGARYFTYVSAEGAQTRIP